MQKLFKKFPDTYLHVIGLNCHIITSHYTKVEKMSNYFFKRFRWKITNVIGADKKGYDQSRQHIKKKRHYFANEGPTSQDYGFSSSHVWM